MTGRSAETALRGGRTTLAVVRVGYTVRRPPNANPDFIRRLLDHLAARGFEGTPRSLGAGEAGREVFSYLEPPLADHLIGLGGGKRYEREIK